MRLLPKSLFGRLVLAVLSILIVALLASLGLHLHERSELLMQASGMRAALRISDIVKLFDTLTPADRVRIARVLSSPPFGVSLDAAPAPPADADAELETRSRFFTAMLRRFIGDDRAMHTRFSDPPLAGRQPGWTRGPMEKGWGPMQGGPHFGPGAGYLGQPGASLLAQVQLRDGSWITVQSRQPAQSASWPYRMLWSLAILILAAVAVALLAVRWAIQPLNALANAAEELGRNVHRAPLAESGPTEVARAAHAFNTMQHRLVDYLRSRTQLLAAMSHDLKTPITRLRLRSELLDDPELRERYSRDLEELESMVGSTLDFLRGIDDEEATLPFDVMAMLESLQADLQETGAKVSISGHTDRPYAGQRRALRRCIGNLLDNAIKYGGQAHVSVEDEPGLLVIRVLDEGPGIDPSELEKVFEPFYRIEESRSRETGGTGLGLAIARQIARAQGGEVMLSNRPQRGLEARLNLPRSSAPSSTGHSS